MVLKRIDQIRAESAIVQDLSCAGLRASIVKDVTIHACIVIWKVADTAVIVG
jgi:hypothetical protein